MRLSHFWQLVQDRFGSAQGHSLTRDLVLSGVGQHTASEALEAGYTPDQVWQALCDELEIPAHERAGSPELGAPGASGAAPDH